MSRIIYVRAIYAQQNINKKVKLLELLTSLTIITPIMKRKQSVAQLNGKNDILTNIIIGNLQALRDNNFFSTVHEGFSGYSGEK